MDNQTFVRRGHTETSLLDCTSGRVEEKEKKISKGKKRNEKEKRRRKRRGKDTYIMYRMTPRAHLLGFVRWR